MQSFGKLLKSIYELVDSVVLSAAAVLLIFTFVFKIFVVSGDSMDAPGIKGDLVEGERIVVSDLGAAPTRGDIICFYSKSEKEVIVKRVIATEGQTVDIRNGAVFVDGVKLSEEYIGNVATLCEGFESSANYVTMPHVVAKDSVFVLGDNRSISLDSRYTRIGDIHKNDIFGKLVVRLFPNFGKVTPTAE